MRSPTPRTPRRPPDGSSGLLRSPFTQLAQITRNPDGPNLIGREFWVGVETSGGDGLLRAGRINLPFGLRNLEHTSFVRTATQTDVNEDQTYGVAFAISRPTVRTRSSAGPRGPPLTFLVQANVYL